MAVSFATSAFAEDRLTVQDALDQNVFKVDDVGNVGINIDTPNYAADVVSKGNTFQSQLHFSIDGGDYGGWLNSALENNFWVSSGAVLNESGQWVQKAYSGNSVFFGSGDAGFRAFMNQGNTAGQPLTNVNPVMVVDYDGNLAMDGGLKMNNDAAATQPACSFATRGMLWMTKSGAGVKDVVQICAQGDGGALGWQNLSF